MTHLTVGLDDAEAAELAAEASRQGVGADELARRALVQYLERARLSTTQAEPQEAFAFVAMLGSDELRGEHTDELLAGGFGR